MPTWAALAWAVGLPTVSTIRTRAVSAVACFCWLFHARRPSMRSTIPRSAP
jgi:hypothetical protein